MTNDGAAFEGEFKYGKRNGLGKCKWPNDDVYEGEFHDDAIQGSNFNKN